MLTLCYCFTQAEERVAKLRERRLLLEIVHGERLGETEALREELRRALFAIAATSRSRDAQLAAAGEEMEEMKLQLLEERS